MAKMKAPVPETEQPTIPTPQTPAEVPGAARQNEAYVEIAQDADGWHWQLWAGNGRALARNPVAYDSKKHCLQAVRQLPEVAAKVKVIMKASSD